MAIAPTPFLTDLAFPESPRWHAGALWFSDFHLQRVCRADASTGAVETVVEVPGQPSGLGWDPAGRLLVVSMLERRVLRLAGKALVAIAELGAWARGPCNDMLVDPRGRAYVGNFGFDLHARARFAPTVLLMVGPSGEVRVVADDMHFPNGMVLAPDGRTLVVAESYGQRLTAFDVREDGTLENRRNWAQLEGRAGPDGICLDAEGAIWVASPVTREVLRVREGGAVTHRIPLPQQALACALGGAQGRTLFICGGHVMTPAEEARAQRPGRIWALEVEVPGA